MSQQKTDNNTIQSVNTQKGERARREEETLSFWEKNRIFEKTLKQTEGNEEFVFYEGPPTANGRPGIHHLEARAFKDAIPRYKTMQGYHVRRKGGWDTHGLPVELEVEKQLGLRSKTEIEEYGIEAFNEKCRESVWTYVNEWHDFTERTGYWVDLDDPYVTYKPDYIESLWNVVASANKRELLYQDYKVVPWCARCGTTLSSHELAQGYEDVKDLTVYVAFKITNRDQYLLAWTTTPWTLPGNVALAVSKDISYVRVEIAGKDLWLAEDRVPYVAPDAEIKEQIAGSELIGLSYEPLYPYLSNLLPKAQQEQYKKAFQVYDADFVTTEEGAGIVHIAAMYGQDDFDLSSQVDLPKFHIVDAAGKFIAGTDFLEGAFVKDEETNVAIIKDLAHRDFLIHKEKIEHSYPHCWRCKTPLIYYARSSWYIKMSSLRNELLSENKDINWEPEHIREGRFGDWLNEVKDWAISRERYWATPLPVWISQDGETREVIGSRDELFQRAPDKIAKTFFLRHGESEKNVQGVYDSSRDEYGLTEAGQKQARDAAATLADENVITIYTSPVRRARETARIIADELGCEVVEADELWEVKSGEWDGQTVDVPEVAKQREAYYALSPDEHYTTKRGMTGESWQDVEERAAPFIRNMIEKHQDGAVVFVSHQSTKAFAMRPFKQWSVEETLDHRLWDETIVAHGVPTKLYIDRARGVELDPHRPYIDAITYEKNGTIMRRVPDVMDVWFDSGAMPFAQYHYPFENKEYVDTVGYPADFISEAIDQTRGWFYTLHAVGAILKRGKAYRNVISLGHILDAEGRKMSKSKGNAVSPWELMNTYGADALRFWMYSVNQPGEPKNFDERTVDEVVKKVFNLLSNVLRFYEMYRDQEHTSAGAESENVLDRWIISSQNKLVADVTEGLNSYNLLSASRAIRSFVEDLSQWYLRRSRDRVKAGDKDALTTLRSVLLAVSKIMAPFTPFFAEDLYRRIGGERESVHLEDWPEAGNVDSEVLNKMQQIREFITEALDKRSEAGIKVRQPLQTLYSVHPIEEEYKEIIKDEVNVKNVEQTKKDSEDGKLDTELTDELKREGVIREVTRAVQGLRKDADLEPGQPAQLTVASDDAGQKLLEEWADELKQTASLSEIAYADNTEGKEVEANDFRFVLALS